MNDDRPIEKLLRRAAKKRSDESGPPPELHPANRRSLQDEVARQFPKPEAPKQSALTDWWLLIKQRWAYGVGVIAVIWVAAVAIMPLLSKPKPQTELAFNSPPAEKLGMKVMKDAAVSPAPLDAPVAQTGAAVMAADHSASAFNAPSAESARTIAAPPAARPGAVNVASAAKRTADLRRDSQEVSASFTNSLAANDSLPPLRPASPPDRVAPGSRAKETFNRAVPVSPAPSPQPERTASARTGSGILTERQTSLALKPEADRLALSKNERSEFDAIGSAAVSAPIVAPAEAKTDAYHSDKTFIARGGGLEREQLTRTAQQFFNTAAAPAARKRDLRNYDPAPTPVLVNFKIEQAGRDLRVVDTDGSVYTGVVDEENTLYKQAVERQNRNLSNSYGIKFKFQTPKLAEPPSGAKSSAANYYAYRVEGTNRTLNQNIVFTWNFVDTNALAAGNLNFNATAPKLDATKLPSQFPALLQNSYINGRAQFGEGREVEVNAVPVKP